jgi:hypothetical protein
VARFSQTQNVAGTKAQPKTAGMERRENEEPEGQGSRFRQSVANGGEGGAALLWRDRIGESFGAISLSLLESGLGRCKAFLGFRMGC